MLSLLIALKSGFIRVSRSRMRLGLGAAMMLFLLISLGLQAAMPARAQILPGLEKVSGEVSSEAMIPMFRRGNLELAPIFLDGNMLGLASSFISVRLRDDSITNAAKISAVNRAYIIHGRLQKHLHAMSLYSKNLADVRGIRDPDEQERIISGQLSTSFIEEENTVISTLTFPANSVPEQIFAITKADIEQARLQSSEPSQIAKRSSTLVKKELIAAWRNRQPPQLAKAAIRASYVIIGLIIFSLLLTIMQRRFKRYALKLADQLESEIQSTEISNPESSQGPVAGGFSFTTNPLRRLSLRQRSSATSLYRILLFWLHWLLWILGVAQICSLFYFSRPLSNWILGVSILGQTPGQPFSSFPPRDWIISLGAQATIGPPLLIILLLICTSVAIRLGNLGVDVYIKRLAGEQVDQRLQLRSPTIAYAIKGWIQAIIYLVFGIIVIFQLHQLGTFTQTVAIFAGFLSFAVSLASQGLLKDLIGGLLILWEDQFAAGDVIIVGNHAGLVEKVSLRVTKLRSLDGELITIPNGSIDVVRNLSSDWSQVNYAIDLNYGVDVNQVLAIMDAVAQDMYQDPEWRKQILQPPEILGIENISHTGISIRMIIKTLPLQQWAAGREYRRRLKIALDNEGIDVGVPRLELKHPVP